jgi:hypothetical protein
MAAGAAGAVVTPWSLVPVVTGSFRSWTNCVRQRDAWLEQRPFADGYRATAYGQPGHALAVGEAATKKEASEAACRAALRYMSEATRRGGV